MFVLILLIISFVAYFILILTMYFVANFIIDLLLRGFAPFYPSRPKVVKQIMREIKFYNREPKMLALSTGRAGFFYALEQRYPNSELIGIEPSLFPYLVARLQIWIRESNIKVHYKKAHDVDMKSFDFIYNHLYPEDMVGLGKKMKFECRPGTQVVSTGFHIAGLTTLKIIKFVEEKGQFDFLSRNKKIFQAQSKKARKEQKAFFYEI